MKYMQEYFKYDDEILHGIAKSLRYDEISGLLGLRETKTLSITLRSENPNQPIGDRVFLIQNGEVTDHGSDILRIFAKRLSNQNYEKEKFLVDL
jgi:hypothetical protein